MAAPSDLRAMAPAVLGLAVLLVVVALVQDRSIGRWTEVEDARLRSALVDGARDVDDVLTQRVAETGAPFVEVYADPGSIADSLADRLGRVDGDALPIQDVYWVEPGASPTLRRLDPNVRALVDAPWEEAGTSWQRYFSREVSTPQTGMPFEITNEAAPIANATLAFPALPSPGAPVPFVLVMLDTTALTSSTFPDLLRETLALGDAFDVTLGPAGEPAIYASRPDRGPLTQPDLARPVGARLLTALTLTLTEAGGRRELNVNQGEIAPGKALWELRIQHRAGSIGAAVNRLRWQQRGLALAALLVLGGAVALLVRSALAQRALARRQMAFVAGVSHELRTPLAVLGAAGENLADGVVAAPDDVRAYGTLVRDESRRLAETVESVLALGGVEARAPAREPVSISDIAHDTAEAVAPLLAETATELRVDVADALPPVHADRQALGTALRNLLANAARHGGPHVSLLARRIDGTVEITVEDDGDGPPSIDVFEPFVRGETGASGSGLGLALVRRVAESHSGQASLARTPEGRTRATLTLPLIL